MRTRRCAAAATLLVLSLFLAACGVFEVGVVPTPTATPTLRRYTNDEYGFSFTYPSSWSIRQGDHVVRLCKGGPCLTVAYKWPSEAVPITWEGGVAGDFVYGGKLDFLGVTVESQLVVYDRAYKVLVYRIQPPTRAQDVAFAIWLDDTSVDYSRVDLTDGLIAEAGSIVASFEIVPSSSPTPTPSPTPAPAPTTLQAAASAPPPALGRTRSRDVDGATMVYVPAGSFTMGLGDDVLPDAQALCEATQAEGSPACDLEGATPAHRVALSAFWIDRTEVLNEAYAQCVDAGVCEAQPVPVNDPLGNAGFLDPELFEPEKPAVLVFWQGAQDYCAWVGGRLPTEAEWEYAARGPEDPLFPWGQSLDGSRADICDVRCDAIWPEDEAAYGRSWADLTLDDGFAYAAPVGTYVDGASWCGALDLSGNVSEWTADWMAPYTADDQQDPTGPQGEGEFRVVRGGSWRSPPPHATALYRSASRPESASAETGFRCVIPAR